MGNQWHDAGSIISLGKYPIDSLESSAAKALLAKCRHDLERNGVCELKDFVTPHGLSLLVQESVQLEDNAFFNGVVGNAYLDEPASDLPPDHVRRMTEPTHLGVVAYDQFPKTSVLRQIYEWEPLMLFIGAVLQLDKIYRYGDPMGALNLSVMRDGDYLRWHFDQTDFVSSLMIRNSEQGGHFEYVPALRSSENENYEKVRAVLEGSKQSVVHLENAAGSLVLFRGRYSLHRVTPIEGKTSRLIGLFGFDTKPGVTSSDHLRKIRYGRTQVLHTP
jgi:hypothetical protein